MKHVALMLIALAACGKVQGDDDPGAPTDGSTDAPADGAVPLDAPPDADLCPRFAVPPGALALHAAFCTSALGFNPTVMPDNMTLPCPGSGAATPGTYGKILRPAALNQIDGCPATAPFTRILAPVVNGAITQISTAANLTVATGDRLRVRVACPMSVPNCFSQIQITGRPGPGGSLQPILPVRTVSNQVMDIDVPMPAALFGNTTIINFLVIANSGTPDLLWENPSLGQ